jgi:hypothetical protein
VTFSLVDSPKTIGGRQGMAASIVYFYQKGVFTPNARDADDRTNAEIAENKTRLS